MLALLYLTKCTGNAKVVGLGIAFAIGITLATRRSKEMILPERRYSKGRHRANLCRNHRRSSSSLTQTLPAKLEQSWPRLIPIGTRGIDPRNA